MTLQQLNNLTARQFKEELFECCGSTAWVTKLSEKIPFESIEELKKVADAAWSGCKKKDWLEAFSHHPKIGDVKSLEKKFATTKQWTSGEQAGVNTAAQTVLQELKDLNDAYEKKFGYIFIVCATGKSAGEMLSILKSRLKNSADVEIKMASVEQNKITHLRLEKLLA